MIERNRVKNITSLGMDDYALGVTVEQLGMLKNVPEYMSGYNMMAKKFEEGKAVKK